MLKEFWQKGFDGIQVRAGDAEHGAARLPSMQSAIGAPLRMQPAAPASRLRGRGAPGKRHWWNGGQGAPVHCAFTARSSASPFLAPPQEAEMEIARDAARLRAENERARELQAARQKTYEQEL